MLAVRFEEQRVVLQDVARPTGDGVRVKVRACGICGSDVTILDSGFPIAGIPGHEIAGELDDGTPVAIEPLAACGACAYCEAGDTQVCVAGNAMIVGIGRDGGMAEELLVPERCLVPLPRGLDATTGFLVEPLAVAVHGVRRSGIEGGERVLVVGGGTIGLCAAVAARGAGAPVDLIARHPAQVAAAKQVGANVIEAASGGDYDVVLDCAGTPGAILTACDALKPKGTLGMLASSWDTFEFPGLVVAAKELDIVISAMYGRAGTLRDVDVAARLLGEDEAIADALVSDRFPLDRAADAFERTRDRKGGAIKVVLEP
ncbi:MAG: alcohol dehydrogenase catalytic domain-containing protein [Myxococcota bacterium]